MVPDHPQRVEAMGEVTDLGQRGLNAARSPKGLGHYSSQPARKRLCFLAASFAILHRHLETPGGQCPGTDRGRASSSLSTSLSSLSPPGCGWGRWPPTALLCPRTNCTPDGKKESDTRWVPSLPVACRHQLQLSQVKFLAVWGSHR